MKNFLLLLVILFLILPASAQKQKLPSTLLWRISGNGLQKPSYLYGTMHLTDERVFNLGDSLYAALDNSDGFATEIDPSEFTSLVINEVKKSAKNKVLVRDFLSKEKFEKYGKLLAERLHKDANEITTNDILEEKNRWITESRKNGKMKTFLDMYLYDIGRRKGKWTSGIEDPQDQGNLEEKVSEEDIEQIAMNENYENFSETENTFGDFFINAYINGDLNIIDSISGLSDSLSNDAILVRRNLKMSSRIDSMSHVRTTVFAIGAAHLPGQDGLIELLKKKGFSVTPVFSSKKIKPSDYKVKEVAIKWYDVKDENGLYTVSMPGMAGDMDYYGFMKMKLFYDPFSSTVYMTSAMNTPYSKQMGDSLFDNLANEFFGSVKSRKSKPVTVNNIPGFEYESNNDSYSRGYLLFKEGKMYMALARSMKKTPSGATEISRFLHSFSINKMVAAKENSFHYVNKTKAYELMLPTPPQSAAELMAGAKDSTINNEAFYCVDPATGNYFFFGTNESAPGYFIINDSSILARLGQAQREKLKMIYIDTFFTNNHSRNLILGGLNSNAGLMVKAQFRFRGNRWYALVVVYDSSKDQTPIRQFFDSFSTLEYAKTNWSIQASADKLFQTWAPGNFNLAKPDEEEENKSVYHSFDSTRGDTYSLILEKFSKYLWHNDDSTFWKLMVTGNTSSDSVLSSKKIQNGEVKGYEYELNQKGSSNIKRVRMLLDADRMFTLITIQAGQEIHNDNNNQFFENFRIDQPSSGPGLFVSKAELLLNDIASADSTTANAARDYLSKASFNKANLPLLHRALLIHYTEEESMDNEQVKMQISRIIRNLNDSSSFTFAKNNYPISDDTTRNALLNIMASFPTHENFIILKNILKNNTSRIAPDDYFATLFTDSIALAARVLPELLPLVKDSIMSASIIDIAKHVADSGLLNKAQLIPYEPELLHLSEKSYNGLEKFPYDYQFVKYNLQELIAKLNTSASNAMLQRWSEGSHNYLKYYAVLYLLQNKQPIKVNAVNDLGENKYTRIPLYDTLKFYNKLKLYPAKYALQKSFAESLVFSADDDYDIDEVVFLSEKIIEFQGKKSKFYFFKMGYGEGDDRQYILAGAGPFSLTSTDLTTKDAYGTIYYDDNFDASKLNEQIDELIRQMKQDADYRRENAGEN